MSYNVDSVECLKLDAKIKLTTLRSLLKKFGDNVPNGTFLYEHKDHKPDVDGFVKLTNLWWYGEWSGNSIEKFEEALTKIEGTAEIILTWEGGDSFTGYRVDNGLVQSCQVIMTLGKTIESTGTKRQ